MLAPDGYKVCSKCGEAKPETPEFFYRQNRGKNGLLGSCKACCQSAYAVHYAENREREIAKTVRWSKKNPEKKKAKDRRYRENRPRRAKGGDARIMGAPARRKEPRSRMGAGGARA